MRWVAAEVGYRGHGTRLSQRPGRLSGAAAGKPDNGLGLPLAKVKPQPEPSEPAGNDAGGGRHSLDDRVGAAGDYEDVVVGVKPVCDLCFAHRVAGRPGAGSKAQAAARRGPHVGHLGEKAFPAQLLPHTAQATNGQEREAEVCGWRAGASATPGPRHLRNACHREPGFRTSLRNKGLVVGFDAGLLDRRRGLQQGPQLRSFGLVLAEIHHSDSCIRTAS